MTGVRSSERGTTAPPFARPSLLLPTARADQTVERPNYRKTGGRPKGRTTTRFNYQTVEGVAG